MRVKEALDKASKRLSPKLDNARREASLLLANWLEKDTMWLVMHDDAMIEDSDGYFEWIERRFNDEPYEYIVEKASFYSREFIVHEGVLIPRPETEILIDHALGLIEGIENPRIVEIGVGSGIISTMLALQRQDSTIIAGDISDKALVNAKANIEKFGVEKQVSLVKSSLLDAIDGDFDLLVSNPPYIAQDELLEEHVMKEPHRALFGGEVGDELLRDIIFTCKQRKIPHIACEIGYDQQKSMQRVLDEVGAVKSTFYQDLAGHDRGFTATF